MLDNHDRERFAAIYRLLADVLEHEAHVDRSNDAMSYRLGDLAARVFMGVPAEPPDDVLESAVHALRSGGSEDRQQLAVRLRAHAEQLERAASGG
jgi:hypothetical protein